MHADDVAMQEEMFRRYRWLGLLALGFGFLLLVPWLQRAFWLTQIPGQMQRGWIGLVWPLAVETGLCIGVLLLGAAIGCVDEADRIAKSIVSYIERRTIWLTTFTFIAAVLLPLSAAWFVLDRFPNSGDEFSYLFQARTFAGFRLWEDPPVLETDLIPFRTWIFESKWISQYPPGWPMVLSVGLLLGLPTWMMNAILGGATWPLVLTGFQREVFSREEPFRLAAQAMLANAVVILDTTSGLGLNQWDLVRNLPSMDEAVLYARSSTDIGALRKAFPKRSIWRYSRPNPTQPGQLVRVTSH